MKTSLTEVAAAAGWFNICAVLKEKDGVPFYPRGFPYEQRWRPAEITSANAAVRVAVNAGLWLGDPDVDATTRLCRAVDAVAFDAAPYGESFALAPGTWSPINTQNTAFARETIPAAFVSPFAGRFDDILSGYFLRRIIDHLGWSVTYGVPLLNQVRNAHNLWKDFDMERPGNETCSRLTQLLRDTTPKGADFADCFASLVGQAKREIDFAESYYRPILEGMEIWAEAFA